MNAKFEAKLVNEIEQMYTDINITDVKIVRCFVHVTHQLKAVGTVEFTSNDNDSLHWVGGLFPIRDEIDTALTDICDATGNTQIDIVSTIPSSKVLAAYPNQPARWM